MTALTFKDTEPLEGSEPRTDPVAELAVTAVATGTPGSGSAGSGMFRRIAKPLVSALLSVLVFVAAWLAFIALFNLNPLVAKSPLDVLHFFVNGGAKGEPASEVWHALRQTIVDAGFGLVAGLVAAIAVALVFVLSRLAEQSFLPLAVVVRSVPLVAMTPLITLLCGRGLFGTTVISGIVVFFPALVTMSFGLRSTPRQAAELVRAYGGGSWTIMRKVMLPNSLPAMFAATRVAVPGALVGALLAEFFASGKGIGYQISLDESSFSYDSLWSAVTVVTMISVLSYYAVQAVENVVLARFGPSPTSR